MLASFVAGLASLVARCMQMQRPRDAPAQINHVNEREVTALSWCPCQPRELACCSEDSTLTLWNSRPASGAPPADSDSSCIYHPGHVHGKAVAMVAQHCAAPPIAAPAAHACVPGDTDPPSRRSIDVPALTCSAPDAQRSPAMLAGWNPSASTSRHHVRGAGGASARAQGWLMNVSPQRHGRNGLVWHNHSAPHSHSHLESLAADDASQPTRCGGRNCLSAEACIACIRTLPACGTALSLCQAFGFCAETATVGMHEKDRNPATLGRPIPSLSCF